MERRSASAFLLDQLVSKAAEQRPDAVAVRAGSTSLTYAELDGRANQVARVLAELGVRPGDRVALHAEKSVQLVACLYGILRLGAAYVPVDPASPPSRAASIMKDCSVAAVVADPHLLHRLTQAGAESPKRGIILGTEAPAGFVPWRQVEQQAGGRPHSASTVVDTDLAYILYTSGSTGKPKGVMISHRNCLTFIHWAQATLDLREDDVLSNHAPFHFDLSTLDLFGAAATGATVSLVPADVARFPVRLRDWIRAEGITVWYSVPSALSLLIRFGDLGEHSLDSLRLVLFAGEIFPTRYLSQLMKLVPQSRYVNLYGPTETNVCTYEEVTEVAPDDPPLSIGRSCANTRCVVVGDDGQPRHRPGDVGELVVTGSTVAQGYWGDQERTAAGFAQPYTYRTGDIVEVLDDSASPRFRFLGRRDHLVKTRGYRVELGEIEAALYAHAGVQECAAVAVPDELMSNRIVAFCLVDDVSAAELRDLCRARLPGYMVPQRIFLTREGLPRTPNDKIDRQRLSQIAIDQTKDNE